MFRSVRAICLASVVVATPVVCLAEVFLNEINYHEVTGEQEFVELYAPHGSVDITGWALTDQDALSFVFSRADGRFPCAEPFVLRAGDFVVVYSGQGESVCSGPSRAIYVGGSTYLDRDGDDVSLFDANGICRDYVEFENGGDALPPGCSWSGPNPANGNVKGTSISRLDSPFVDTDRGLDFETSGSELTIGPTTAGEINAGFDSDGDGAFDRADNCPGDFNPDQADLDRNGIGDLCDGDDDGDTFADAIDNCPADYNPEQDDLDGDTLGDACDGDDDGDGLDDLGDNCPIVFNPEQEDSDDDGLGDACNGIPLVVEIPILEQDIRTGHPEWAQHRQQPTARIGIRNAIIYRSLGWIDVSGFVERARIDDVHLVYQATSGDPEAIPNNGDIDPGGGTVLAEIHPILRSWNYDEPLLYPEDTSDNDKGEEEGETSWNNALFSPISGLNQPWEIAGAGGAGDRGPAVAAAAVDSQIDARIEFNDAALTELVGAWANGVTPNHGFLIKASDFDELGIKNSKILCGKGFPLETSTGLGHLEAISHRPYARIEYHVDPFDPANRPPVAADLTQLLREDRPAGFRLEGEDPDGDPLVFRILAPPAFGTLTGTPPSVVYTPNPDFSGTDELTFQVDDGRGGVDSARVVLRVFPVNDAPLALDSFVDVAQDGSASITLDGFDVDGDALAYAIITPPPFGTLTSDDGDEVVVYTPDPGFAGTDSFEFAVSDGRLNSATATVSINVSPHLFEDDFERADGPDLRRGWRELELADANIELIDGRMVFTDTSDHENRPIAQHDFEEVADGRLEWRLLFDWTRIGEESKYFIFMQLGDAAAMSDTDRRTGVGVHLVWGRIGGVNETLAYQVDGSNFPLAQISGATSISVVADLESGSYDLVVDDEIVAEGLPFDADVPLNSVRFLADSMREEMFTGRAFDHVILTRLVAP